MNRTRIKVANRAPHRRKALCVHPVPRAGRVTLTRRRSYSRAVSSQLQGLDLEILLQTVGSQLAAIATLLVATERCQSVETAAVDVDHPGTQPTAERHCPILVGGEYRSGQSIGCVVRDGHRLVLVAVRDHDQHRTKDLFLLDS